MARKNSQRRKSRRVSYTLLPKIQLKLQSVIRVTQLVIMIGHQQHSRNNSKTHRLAPNKILGYLPARQITLRLLRSSLLKHNPR